MSKMKYIATISGGKDSTVMCDLLLKNNYPIVIRSINNRKIRLELHEKLANRYFEMSPDFCPEEGIR